MTSFDIAVSISGNFEQAINSLEKAIGQESLTEWLEGPVDNHLYQRAVARFHGQGDDASGHWPDLSPYTIADREARGFSDGPPEYRSGSLMAYITSGGEAHPDGLDAVLQFPGRGPQDTEMQIKVGVAQTGARGHDGHKATPPRPVLALAPLDVEDILLSLTERIGALILAGV